MALVCGFVFIKDRTHVSTAQFGPEEVNTTRIKERVNPFLWQSESLRVGVGWGESEEGGRGGIAVNNSLILCF